MRITDTARHYSLSSFQLPLVQLKDTALTTSAIASLSFAQITRQLMGLTDKVFLFSCAALCASIAAAINSTISDEYFPYSANISTSLVQTMTFSTKALLVSAVAYYGLWGVSAGASRYGLLAYRTVLAKIRESLAEAAKNMQEEELVELLQRYLGYFQAATDSLPQGEVSHELFLAADSLLAEMERVRDFDNFLDRYPQLESSWLEIQEKVESLGRRSLIEQENLPEQLFYLQRQAASMRLEYVPVSHSVTVFSGYTEAAQFVFENFSKARAAYWDLPEGIDERTPRRLFEEMDTRLEAFSFTRRIAAEIYIEKLFDRSYEKLRANLCDLSANPHLKTVLELLKRKDPSEPVTLICLKTHQVFNYIHSLSSHVKQIESDILYYYIHLEANSASGNLFFALEHLSEEQKLERYIFDKKYGSLEEKRALFNEITVFLRALPPEEKARLNKAVQADVEDLLCEQDKALLAASNRIKECAVGRINGIHSFYLDLPGEFRCLSEISQAKVFDTKEQQQIDQMVSEKLLHLVSSAFQDENFLRGQIQFGKESLIASKAYRTLFRVGEYLGKISGTKEIVERPHQVLFLQNLIGSHVGLGNETEIVRDQYAGWVYSELYGGSIRWALRNVETLTMAHVDGFFRFLKPEKAVEVVKNSVNTLWMWKEHENFFEREVNLDASEREKCLEHRQKIFVSINQLLESYLGEPLFVDREGKMADARNGQIIWDFGDLEDDTDWRFTDYGSLQLLKALHYLK